MSIGFFVHLKPVRRLTQFGLIVVALLATASSIVAFRLQALKESFEQEVTLLQESGRPVLPQDIGYPPFPQLDPLAHELSDLHEQLDVSPVHIHFHAQSVLLSETLGIPTLDYRIEPQVLQMYIEYNNRNRAVMGELNRVVQSDPKRTGSIMYHDAFFARDPYMDYLLDRFNELYVVEMVIATESEGPATVVDAFVEGMEFARFCGAEPFFGIKTRQRNQYNRLLTGLKRALYYCDFSDTELRALQRTLADHYREMSLVPGIEQNATFYHACVFANADDLLWYSPVSWYVRMRQFENDVAYMKGVRQLLGFLKDELPNATPPTSVFELLEDSRWAFEDRIFVCAPSGEILVASYWSLIPRLKRDRTEFIWAICAIGALRIMEDSSMVPSGVSEIDLPRELFQAGMESKEIIDAVRLVEHNGELIVGDSVSIDAYYRRGDIPLYSRKNWEVWPFVIPIGQ